jgi:hypothetical protein
MSVDRSDRDSALREENYNVIGRDNKDGTGRANDGETMLVVFGLGKGTKRGEKGRVSFSRLHGWTLDQCRVYKW